MKQRGNSGGVFLDVRGNLRQGGNEGVNCLLGYLRKGIYYPGTAWWVCLSTALAYFTYILSHRGIGGQRVWVGVSKGKDKWNNRKQILSSCVKIWTNPVLFLYTLCLQCDIFQIGVEMINCKGHVYNQINMNTQSCEKGKKAKWQSEAQEQSLWSTFTFSSVCCNI